MVVNYDPGKTLGLTNDDMVGAISATYGTRNPTRCEDDHFFIGPRLQRDPKKSMARWEDSQYSFNLFRSSYQPNFGMVVFSKRLDALARLAIVEPIRRDQQEAPQREAEQQKKEAQETRATEEKARLANKTNFRP